MKNVKKSDLYSMLKYLLEVNMQLPTEATTIFETTTHITVFYNDIFKDKKEAYGFISKFDKYLKSLSNNKLCIACWDFDKKSNEAEVKITPILIRCDWNVVEDDTKASQP